MCAFVLVARPCHGHSLVCHCQLLAHNVQLLAWCRWRFSEGELAGWRQGLECMQQAHTSSRRAQYVLVSTEVLADM